MPDTSCLRFLVCFGAAFQHLLGGPNYNTKPKTGKARLQLRAAWSLAVQQNQWCVQFDTFYASGFGAMEMSALPFPWALFKGNPGFDSLLRELRGMVECTLPWLPRFVKGKLGAYTPSTCLSEGWRPPLRIESWPLLGGEVTYSRRLF